MMTTQQQIPALESGGPAGFSARRSKRACVHVLPAIFSDASHKPHPGPHTEESADEESELLDLPVNPDEGADLIPDDETNVSVPS
jgi:hypothetical protein